MPIMDEEEKLPVTTLLVIIVCVLAFICVVVALIWCCARGTWKKTKKRKVVKRVINPGAIIPYAAPMPYAPQAVTSNINVQCSCGNRAVASPANNAPSGGNYNLRVLPVAGTGAPAAGVCPIMPTKPAMVSVPKSAPMYPWLRKYFNSSVDNRAQIHGQYQQRSAAGPSYIVQEPMEPMYASNNANIPIITPITTDDRCPSCPNPGYSNGGYNTGGCGGCGESIYSHATTDYSNNYSHYTSAYGGNAHGQGPHVVSIGL